MKKAGQLMKEMGFNEKASDSAKEAFIKYLIKQSTGVNVTTPSEKKAMEEFPEKIVKFPSQLEFVFEESDEKLIKKTGQ